MKTQYSFIDPGAIMGVVVALIILGVGVFAFFVVLEQTDASLDTTTALGDAGHNQLMNLSETGDSVFNIVGIVLIIGAIMSIVGLVYNYVR